MSTDLVVVRARRLAQSAHAGQVDQQGRDYFAGHLEPIALALRPFGPLPEALGLLHDIVEDTDVTADDLRNDGYPALLVDGVIAMSRDYFGPESYADLIERSAAHPLGAVGKLADNTWNVLNNEALAATRPEKAASLLGRYLTARRTLLEATRLDALTVFDMEQTLRGEIARLVAATA